jgi:hypothetical protein
MVRCFAAFDRGALDDRVKPVDYAGSRTGTEEKRALTKEFDFKVDFSRLLVYLCDACY